MSAAAAQQQQQQNPPPPGYGGGSGTPNPLAAAAAGAPTPPVASPFVSQQQALHHQQFGAPAPSQQQQQFFSGNQPNPFGAAPFSGPAPPGGYFGGPPYQSQVPPSYQGPYGHPLARDLWQGAASALPPHLAQNYAHPYYQQQRALPVSQLSSAPQYYPPVTTGPPVVPGVDAAASLANLALTRRPLSTTSWGSYIPNRAAYGAGAPAFDVGADRLADPAFRAQLLDRYPPLEPRDWLARDPRDPLSYMSVLQRDPRDYGVGLGRDQLVGQRESFFAGREPYGAGREPYGAGRDPLFAGRDPLFAGRDPLLAGREPYGAGLPADHLAYGRGGVDGYGASSLLDGRDYLRDILNRRDGPPLGAGAAAANSSLLGRDNLLGGGAAGGGVGGFSRERIDAYLASLSAERSLSAPLFGPRGGLGGYGGGGFESSGVRLGERSPVPKIPEPDVRYIDGLGGAGLTPSGIRRALDNRSEQQQQAQQQQQKQPASGISRATRPESDGAWA